MKRKEINYKYAREYLYNKDKFFSNYLDDMLTKCNQMFNYKNLPDSIPKRILEQFLLENGNCIFTKHNEKYYVFTGGYGGILNEYYEPTKYIVNNPYLNLNKEYNINTDDDDCVLILNDCKGRGILPILSKSAVMCNDCEISINMLTNILRTQYLISAGDNKTKENADIFIKKLMDGDFCSIGENEFFDGVKVHNINSSNSYIKDFIELNQYIKATAYNEIGLDANYNMKRERLTENEIELNTSILIPLADDMLEQRKNAIKKINEKYGLNIEVELSSVWKMQKETVDKATQTENTTMENESTENVANETTENETTENENSENENSENEGGNE